VVKGTHGDWAAMNKNIHFGLAAAALAILACVMPGAGVADDSCSDAVPAENGPLDNAMVTTDLDDLQQVAILINNFTWILDNRDELNLPTLFTNDGAFQVCTTFGIRSYLANGKQDLTDSIHSWFNKLPPKPLVMLRRFATNPVVLSLVREADGTTVIEQKLKLLVSIQRLETSDPVLDYSGVIKATLAKDPQSQVWKIKRITTFQDTPSVTSKGR
jgi:hypothetical protein